MLTQSRGHGDYDYRNSVTLAVIKSDWVYGAADVAFCVVSTDVLGDCVNFGMHRMWANF
jgi:hypothetical protein